MKKHWNTMAEFIEATYHKDPIKLADACDRLAPYRTEGNGWTIFKFNDGTSILVDERGWEVL